MSGATTATVRRSALPWEPAHEPRASDGTAHPAGDGLMDPVAVRELVQRLGGSLRGGAATVTGAAIDSRRLREGDLFVALRGSRVDGHEFVAAAREAGAGAALVERAVDDPLPQWVVPDTRPALAALGALARERTRAVVVGVTGSNGKTTVKEMLAAVLGRLGPVLATAGNYNNELGVPLTLCRLDGSHRFAVIEMGASGPGEIGRLAALARPRVGVVTNAAPAHLEGFGSVEGVARAKGELYAALPPGGEAVINADDAFAELWRELAGSRRRLSFGMAGDADVAGELASDGALKIRLPEEEVAVRLALSGRHNRLNALAAAAVAHAAGAPAADIRAGLESLHPVAGRLDLRAGVADAVIVDDSYNANPASLEAALEAVAERPGRRWLVLGDMAELGPSAAALHAAAGESARRHGFERVFACGSLAAEAARAFGDGGVTLADRDAIVRAVRSGLAADVTVLIKGSRSAGMEAVARALEKNEQGPVEP